MGMAIANALGANIQNVFLALALPWTIQAFANGGKFKMPCEGLVASVMWMLGTLALMVIIILAARCRMPRWAGASFLVIYFIHHTLDSTTDTEHHHERFDPLQQNASSSSLNRAQRTSEFL